MNILARLIIYSIPISALIFQVQHLLQALRCQTSPNWAELRYQNASKNFAYDYAGEGGFLHQLSTTCLFWEDEAASCAAVNMAAGKDVKPFGSLSLLWPLFLSLCGSQFVETFMAAVQGRQPVSENSLFEQSLAFAEAESFVTRPFEIAMLTGKPDPDTAFPLRLGAVKRVMNATPEVLLISLISALGSLSSNVLAIFDKRKKWRLVNTGIWGLAYMGAFMWSLARYWFADDTPDDSIAFRFPTVFVIGFIPHLVIVFGILTCAAIYGFALLLMTLSPLPGQPRAQSFREKFVQAYYNMQANVYLASGENIRFSWTDDFYSSLLKAGFTVLTCASEAVYLNEGTNVRVGNLTWLEQSRLEELSKNQGLLFSKTRASIPDEIRRRTATAFSSSDERDRRVTTNSSGYAVERKPKTRDRNAEPIPFQNSNSSTMWVERHGRLLMALRFLQGLFWLSIGMFLNFCLALLRLFGITHRPEWVVKLLGPSRPRKTRAAPGMSRDAGVEFLVFDDDGTTRVASDPDIDVEAEMRKQEMLAETSSRFSSGEDREQYMDQKLYDWWKKGGWFGDADATGEYDPQDDDNISVVSTTVDSDSGEWLDDDGQRTPTRTDPFPLSDSSLVTNDLVDADMLAALLDPQTAENRQEARMLAQRLRAPGIITRAQYQRKLHLERANILTTSRSLNPTGQMPFGDDEERRLEELLMQTRTKITAHSNSQQASSSQSGPSSWGAGAPGMGSTGPMCVVCQDAPRTVLLWPCGCLSLCDECRVSMATRNFSNCVCCRTPTEAFSRLFVP
jgi:Zinc finger, C3HC4 type (RING finger)